VDIIDAATMPDGIRFWHEWIEAVAPENTTELRALEADAGRNLCYVRLVARRRPGVQLEDPVVSIPAQYSKHPLLRRPVP
jgi:hypothetical protein